MLMPISSYIYYIHKVPSNTKFLFYSRFNRKDLILLVSLNSRIIKFDWYLESSEMGTKRKPKHRTSEAPIPKEYRCADLAILPFDTEHNIYLIKQTPDTNRKNMATNRIILLHNDLSCKGIPCPGYLWRFYCWLCKLIQLNLRPWSWSPRSPARENDKARCDRFWFHSRESYGMGSRCLHKRFRKYCISFWGNTIQMTEPEINTSLIELLGSRESKVASYYGISDTIFRSYIFVLI